MLHADSVKPMLPQMAATVSFTPTLLQAAAASLAGTLRQAFVVAFSAPPASLQYLNAVCAALPS